MIILYTQQATPRLEFACDVLFKRLMNSRFKITSLLEDTRVADGVVINYSRDPSVMGFHISPHQLIRQRGVYTFDPEVIDWEGLPALFPTEGDIPFDIFAATFYLVSRYEEYLPYRGDQFGRFPAEESLAYKEGFLDRPLVDEWVHKLYRLFKDHLPEGHRLPSYRFTTTIDIDSAYAYRFKGLMRTLGGFAKDVLSGDRRNLKDRFNTVVLRKHDPFDTYDQMHDVHQKHGVDAIFFFLLADYGLNDKGVSYKSQHLRRLIRKWGDYYRIGIHPGFQSNREPARLETEIQRLAMISRREVVRARQHFLMLSFPETYRRYQTLGIKEDYTMGYASHPGFRASISRPFSFYDIHSEQMMALEIHPFAVMDATLNMYRGYSPEEASRVIEALAQKVKAVNGAFEILWHNESLSNKWGWEGWQDVYNSAIQSGKA